MLIGALLTVQLTERLMMMLIQFMSIVILFIVFYSAARDVTPSVAADSVVTTSPLPEALCECMQAIN